MRKTLAAISTYVAGAFASEQNLGEFIQYVGQHGKSYNTMEEFQMRFERYNRADSFIKEHYQKNGPEPSFEVAHNKFSDWTEQEYKVLLGYKPMKGKKRTPKGMKVVDVSALAASVDWREKNAVTPVKNQAHCGSCWAFATSAILEGAHSIQTGQLLSFSEQLWVDCVKNQSAYGYISEPEPCCAGCNGGDYDASFSWAGNNSINFVLENDYKYKMVEGTCEYESKDQTRVQVTSYTDVPANSSADLLAALNQQPVGVGVDAGELPFQTYSSGIIDSAACLKGTNHAITAVGYGVRASDNMQYFIVKNSWGSTWGEAGYVRISTAAGTGNGICGVLESPSWATTTTK